MLLLLFAVTGCGGSSCDELAGLRAERDAARAAYADLLRSGTATPQDTEREDEAVHALDRRVYDLEQGC